MRLSDLAGKKIVNIYDGELLGDVGDADLTIDEVTGDIISIILPKKSSMIHLFFDNSFMTIPWSAVKKIGSEVMIVDIDTGHGPLW